MKKLIILLLCMMVLFSSALAEIVLPESVLSQREMQDRFLLNLIGFGSGMNLDKNALRLSVSKSGQSVVDADMQTGSNFFDFDGTVIGLPLHLQFTDTALFTVMGDKVQKLPYSALTQTSSSGMTLPQITPELLQRLSSMVVTKVILPSVKLQQKNGQFYYILDINETQIIALGDEIAADSELAAVFSLFTGGKPFPDMWKTWRAFLRSGLVPISLHAEAAFIGGLVDVSATANVLENVIAIQAKSNGNGLDFGLKVNDQISVAGLVDWANDILKVQINAGTVSERFVFEHTNTGLNIECALANDTDSLAAWIKVKDKSVEGFFELCQTDYLGGNQTVQGSGKYDILSGVLTAQLNLPSEILAVLNGKPENDIYKAELTVSQNGTVFATGNGVFTNTVEQLSAAISLTVENETGTLDAVYAKQTGIYGVKIEGPDAFCVEGSGRFAKDEVYGRFTVDQSGERSARAAFALENNDELFSVFIREDSLFGGNLRNVLDVHAEYDKASGSFSGTYWMPVNHNRIELQGQVNDSMFRRRGSSSRDGSIDMTVMRDQDSFMGNMALRSYSMGLNLTGNFLWSRNAKTLAFTVPMFTLNASLIQNNNGLPMDLRVSLQDQNRTVIEIKASRDGIYFSRNGRVTTISGRFKDERTLTLEIVQNADRPVPGPHFTVNLAVDKDQLQAEVLSEDTGLYAASCKWIEKSEIENLSERKDAVTNPMLLEQLLYQMMFPSENKN